MPGAAEISRIFKEFDTSGDGSISVDELEAALRKGGKKASPEEIADILKQVDANNDGEISLEEFYKVFELAPDALPAGLQDLVDVTGMLLGNMHKAGSALWQPLSKSASSVGDAIGGALDWRDTNVAMIGSDEDKAARKAAAATEEAWEGCGMEVGIEVWRIEQMKVKPWAKKDVGKFYEGDSYIVLHTYKESMLSPKLVHDIYFWLGKDTSQDEMGTAAYKTVELDDLFGGEPVQHRETQLHESSSFKSLFKDKPLSYLKGGVKSGFKKVEAGASVSRLLHVKKMGKTTHVIEVAPVTKSLNEGDAFILDTGSTIYCWYGAQCSPFEKLAANLAGENIEAGRHGSSKVTIEIDDTFWSKLGGKAAIKDQAAAGEGMPQPEPAGEGVLYKLSDAGGKLAITEVARGDLKKSMLSAEDVYLVDLAPGGEVITWVGSGASQKERASAMSTSLEYLKSKGRPVSTSVTMLKEGQEGRSALFKKVFD